MAFFSSAKHSKGNEEVNTASVSTASTNVPTASANIGVASISQDTACAYIASQFSGSQIKFEDINQIDEDDMEEMDIKWNMALLSKRADTYMANDEENHSLVADKEAPTEFALMANTSAESKVFENSLCSKDWLAQVESRLAEHRDREIKYFEKIRGLEYKTESSDEYIEILKKKLDLIKKEKEGLDSKLTGFQTASKDLDSLLESKRLDKNKEALGYSVVPPPPAQIYSSPKKDMSWTGLPELKDTLPVVHRPPMRPMRSNMNGALPNRTSFNKPAHSYANRPFQRTSAVRSQYRAPWVPTVNRIFPPVNRKFSIVSRKFSTVNRKFPTANRKFPTGGTKFSTADMGKKGKAIKPSACNISYLSDYEPFDGGYVSFGQGGCKINGKGTITTECIVLGQNFKLSDDDNVLLRTPRQHNMYSIDLNNIVPHKDLTCLVNKASADECMLWHRRL
nr:hypothetical protein [Tanacetum cinerariifolium]